MSAHDVLSAQTPLDPATVTAILADMPTPYLPLHGYRIPLTGDLFASLAQRMQAYLILNPTKTNWALLSIFYSRAAQAYPRETAELLAELIAMKSECGVAVDTSHWNPLIYANTSEQYIEWMRTAAKLPDPYLGRLRLAI